MLLIRQQLAQRDYKIDLRVARLCRDEIDRHLCLSDVSHVAQFRTAQMSAILLCLEAAVKDG